MKAILVIDEMPRTCGGCPCMKVGREADICQAEWKIVENTDCIPDWCPLKPLPEANTWDVTENGHVTEFAEGWNACLDEITGETE